jgi:hypothetical protein
MLRGEEAAAAAVSSTRMSGVVERRRRRRVVRRRFPFVPRSGGEAQEAEGQRKKKALWG